MGGVCSVLGGGELVVGVMVVGEGRSRSRKRWGGRCRGLRGRLGGRLGGGVSWM